MSCHLLRSVPKTLCDLINVYFFDTYINFAPAGQPRIYAVTPRTCYTYSSIRALRTHGFLAQPQVLSLTGGIPPKGQPKGLNGGSS